MRIDIASFFIMSHRYCIVFYNVASILHRFLMSHRYCIVFYDVASMLHHLLRAPPILPFCIVFCDRALCDRALPLPTRKLTGGGIPLLLRLGVLKKGSARLYVKKGLHPSILHRFLISRIDIASFFNIAYQYCSFFNIAH
jgi:hypothetical protein